MRLTDFEIGWLAGLLEGEGHFGYNQGTPLVDLRMGDEDIVLRALILIQRITGKQHTCLAKEDKRENHSCMFCLRLCGDNARKVMRVVVSHMGSRRRQRIWQVLNGYKPKKVKVDFKAITQNVIALRRGAHL